MQSHNLVGYAKYYLTSWHVIFDMLDVKMLNVVSCRYVTEMNLLKYLFKIFPQTYTVKIHQNPIQFTNLWRVDGAPFVLIMVSKQDWY